MFLPCPECTRSFKNLSGLRRHQNAVHRNDPGLSVPIAELRRIYHPILTGMYNSPRTTLSSFFTGRRCNQAGSPISPTDPPNVPAVKMDDDWSPFSSRAGFELAEFMYADAELSQRKIGKLLELWAATLIPHGDSPPIANYRDLHHQIDAIGLGNVSWEHASIKYNGPPSETVRPPEWKTAEYDVWFRNPRNMIKNIFANPDFEGQVDYAAYQEFSDGHRQYGDVMSGDWAWRQSVCLYSMFYQHAFNISSRTLSPRTPQPKDLCSSQSS